MDASNLLKPLLASGENPLHGARRPITSTAGIFDKDRALSRRFQKIDIVEPDVPRHLPDPERPEVALREPTTACATRIAHCARPPSCRTATITDRFMPDKAIDVIDEAGAAQLLVAPSRRKKSIGAVDVGAGRGEDCARTVEPGHHVGQGSPCATLDVKLKMTVFGQDDAIDTLASAIKLSRAGLKVEGKPIGSFPVRGPDRASARPRCVGNWPTSWVSSCCASTCRSTWSGTPYPG